jgi:hypothetical protein
MADTFDWKAGLAFLKERLPDSATEQQYASFMQKVCFRIHAADHAATSINPKRLKGTKICNSWLRYVFYQVLVDSSSSVLLQVLTLIQCRGNTICALFIGPLLSSLAHSSLAEL